MQKQGCTRPFCIYLDIKIIVTKNQIPDFCTANKTDQDDCIITKKILVAQTQKTSADIVNGGFF